MSVKIIQEKLNAYHCASLQEEEFALREITQEVALAALARTDFFKAAAFQGGTCLRIFYGLERFSEDLDFILRNPDPGFRLDPYLKNLKLEFETYGYQLEISDRSKPDHAARKVFLKDDSLGKILTLTHLKGRTNLRKIRVKLEVDTHPPKGSQFEAKYHDFPFPFSVTLQDPPSLFAGKSHALLCREYTKARDWYDFVWFSARKVPINFGFLRAAIHQRGPWQGQNLKIDLEWYVTQMEQKIRDVLWEEMKREISRFLKPSEQEKVNIWSTEFFLDRLRKLQS